MLQLPLSPAPSADALAAFGEPTPRVRVRDALRRLVGTPGWDAASWTVRQNRLLDEVGSDLRPLVGLLVRAGEGGVADGLPATAAGWPAARGALVVSLTAHSFLLPEMARWAVECWGYAAGVADEAALTVAADARVALWRAAEEQAAEARALAARAEARAAADAEARRAQAAAAPSAGPNATPGGTAAGATTGPASAASAAATIARPGPAAGGVRTGGPGAPATPLGTPAGGRVVPATATAAATAAGAPAVVVRRVAGTAPAGPAPTAAPPRRRKRGRLPEGLDNPVAHVSLAGIAVFVGYVIYSAVRLPASRASDVPRVLATAALPAAAGAMSGTTAVGAGTAPGIPGVTTNGLPQTADDSARMIRVVPARRPTYALEQMPAPAQAAPAPVAVPVPPLAAATPARTGGPGPSGGAGMPPRPAAVAAPAPAAATPVTLPGAPDGYDRLRLRSGRLLRGRVELVRVSAVVFRDADTGLRYEYPKSDVDAVVTEFGTTVRFSPEERAAAAGAPAPTLGAAERAAARLVRRGVGGRYQVTFSVSSVTGSPECQRGWRTAPKPDWARVTHPPGADTLSIAFEGGATFASVIDQEAQFASTFVIVPDQAYSGQALTTRLNGRFAEGGFDAAVNLVGYRRVNSGQDVACLTVLRAVGRRAAK